MLRLPTEWGTHVDHRLIANNSMAPIDLLLELIRVLRDLVAHLVRSGSKPLGVRQEGVLRNRRGCNALYLESFFISHIYTTTLFDCILL